MSVAQKYIGNPSWSEDIRELLGNGKWRSEAENWDTQTSFLNSDELHDETRKAARLLGAYTSCSEAIDHADLKQPVFGAIDVIDMFSGCGGMSAGFKAVSSLVPLYNLVGALDLDSYANKTYETNLGVIPQRNDIVELEKDTCAFDRFLSALPKSRTRPLVLVGCAPCQGFSSHRKKDRNIEDSRNSLVEVFSRIAARVQPEFIVMENVPELLSKKYWGFFERSKLVLENAGYLVRVRVVNMAEFGVPQERFRTLILAAKKPFLMPRGVLEPKNFRTVRQAIGHLTPIQPGIPAKDDPMHVTSHHKKSTIDTISKVPKDGGSRPKGVGPKCLDRVKGFFDVYGRLYWDRPAVTITAYARNPASGRYSHPEQNRGLSIREAALLQGFPKHYVFEGPFDHKFSQIGNAVPPRFAAYLAAHIAGELVGPPLSKDVFEKDLSQDITSPISNSFSSVIAAIKMRR